MGPVKRERPTAHGDPKVPQSCTSDRLASLFTYLDGLTQRPSVEALEERLIALEITLEDVAGHVHFSPNHYLRNLIREGPHYHALALCWRSGQRCPHNRLAGGAATHGTA